MVFRGTWYGVASGSKTWVTARYYLKDEGEKEEILMEL
jgi:hypothetical protein